MTQFSRYLDEEIDDSEINDSYNRLGKIDLIGDTQFLSDCRNKLNGVSDPKLRMKAYFKLLNRAQSASSNAFAKFLLGDNPKNFVEKCFDKGIIKPDDRIKTYFGLVNSGISIPQFMQQDEKPASASQRKGVASLAYLQAVYKRVSDALNMQDQKQRIRQLDNLFSNITHESLRSELSALVSKTNTQVLDQDKGAFSEYFKEYQLKEYLKSLMGSDYTARGLLQDFQKNFQSLRLQYADHLRKVGANKRDADPQLKAKQAAFDEIKRILDQSTEEKSEEKALATLSKLLKVDGASLALNRSFFNRHTGVLVALCFVGVGLVIAACLYASSLLDSSKHHKATLKSSGAIFQHDLLFGENGKSPTMFSQLLKKAEEREGDISDVSKKIPLLKKN